jgi:hypothetical protein
MRIVKLGLLVAAVGLAACNSARVVTGTFEPVTDFNPTKDPYWKDPKWEKTMVIAAQSVVHDPVDAADTSTPGLHGTVKFTFQDGAIEYPEITASTGDPELDKLMLHQLASAQVPRPSGLQTDQPHEFELDLAMPTPYETFQSGIYDAFDAYKIYSREAVMGGYEGTTTVGFDYLDGKLSNVIVAKSSRSQELDKRSLWTVTTAKLPSTPDAYAGKILHMQASFCYALEQSEAESGRCPVARDVIWVTGTRVKRVDTYRYP